MSYDVDFHMPNEVYHARHDCLSASGAKLLLPPSCPAKFHWEQEHGRPPKRHFDFGSAFHRAVLGIGPETVVIEAANYYSTADQKARDAAYRDGKVPILRPEMDKIYEMVGKVRAHPDASVLLDPASGDPEVSVFWDDRETGLPRRCRFDFLPEAVPGLPLQVADLKTTVSVEPGYLAKIMDEHGLHLQAAWYLDAVEAADLHGDAGAEFLWVFIEKDPPYLIKVARPDETALEWARMLNRKALDLWRECRETGEWPGYNATRVEELSLRRWRIRQHEDNYDAGWFNTREDKT